METTSTSTLPPLSTIKLAPTPCQVDAHTQALQALKRIDRVQVCALPHRRWQTRIFLIQIYRLSSTTQNPATIEPHVQIEHSYAEFAALRHAMHDAASNHYPMWCEFCSVVLHRFIRDEAQPHTLLPWLHDDVYIEGMLTQFLTNALGLLTQFPMQPRVGFRVCQGKSEIPQLLQDFLLPTASNALPN